MTEVTKFERVWNSTLGVPQQVFLRALRAAQRDDVDLFSHRGLLDWSLVPIAGIWDDGEAREDVGFEEAFDLTFGKMGVPKNWGTQFAANIITDPINLFSGGLTATARTARAAQKAMRITEVRGALKGSKLSDLKAAVDETLQGKHGIITGKRRSLLKRAQKELSTSEVADDMALGALERKGGEQELRFGMPSLIGRGSMQWRTPEYSSWVKFAADKTPGVGAAAGFLKPAIQSSDGNLRPVLRDLADKWNAIKGGVRTAPLNFETGRYGVLAPGRQRVNLDGLNQRMYKEVLADTNQAAGRFAAEFARNQDAGRALSVALGMTKPGAKVKSVFNPARVDDAWRQMRGEGAEFFNPKGAESAQEWAKRQFDAFRADYDATTGAFRELLGPTSVETAAGVARRAAIETGNLGLFQKARAARRGLRKLFVTDVSSEKIIAAEKTWRTMSAKAQDQMEEILATGGQIMAEASAELGVPPELLARVAVTAMEGIAPAEELRYWERMAQVNVGDPKLALSAEAFAERQVAAVDGLVAYLRDFQDNPAARSLLDVLEPLAKEGIKGRTITARFNALAEISDVLRPDLKAAAGNGAGANVLVSAASRASGQYLAFIPNHRLRSIAEKLKGRLEARKVGAFDEDFVAEMLELYPDVNDIWKRTGMSAPDFAKTMTGLRGVTEITEKLAELERGAAAQAVSAAQDFTTGQRAIKTAKETAATLARDKKNVLARAEQGRQQAVAALAEVDEGLEHAAQQLESAKAAKKLALNRRKRAANAEKIAKQQAKAAEKAAKVAEETGTPVPHDLSQPPVPSTMEANDVFDVTATKFRAYEEQEKHWLAQIKALESVKKDISRTIAAWAAMTGEEASRAAGSLKAAQSTAKETSKAVAKLIAQGDKATAKWNEVLKRANTTLNTQIEAARARIGIGQEDMRTLLNRQAEMDPVLTLEGYKADISKIEAVLRRRDAGEEVWRQKPRAVKVRKPAGARDILDIAIEPGTTQILDEMGMTFEEAAARIEQIGLPRVEQGDMIDGALGLLVTSAEMKRHAAKFPKEALPPTLVDKAIGFAQKSSGAIEDAMFKALGPKGQGYLEHIRYLRGQVHATSAALGNIVPGSPFGYIGHVLTREQKLSLKAAFGEDGIGTLMDTGAPRLAASMRRRLDSLTLHELNLMHRELLKSGGEQGKRTLAVLDEIAKGLGYEQGFKQFEDDPLLALTTRLSQNQRAMSAGHFLRQAALDSDGGLVLGRVQRFVQAGEKISVGKVRRLETIEEGAAPVASKSTDPLPVTKGQRGRNGKVKTGGTPVDQWPSAPEAPAAPQGQSKYRVVEDDMNVAEIEGAIVLTDEGELFVPSYALGNGTAILDLGQPRVAGIGDESIELSGSFDAADAFALRTMRGTISERDFVRGGSSSFESMKGRLSGAAPGGVGSFVALGNEEMLTSVVSAIQNQWKNPGAALAVVDSVDYFLRKAATIWRPAFVIGNQVSYIGQTSILVKNPRSIFGGYADAARFFAQDNRLNAVYDPVVQAISEPGQFKMGFDPVSVARRGVKDPDLATLEKMGVKADELVYRLGNGVEITRGEILRGLRDVLISHTREGLRGTGRISETAEKVAKAGRARSTTLGKVNSEVKKFLEGSEALPRMATIFAQLREGAGLREAVENSLMVHVNYADLTQFERGFVKRVLGFYTFARKFAPVAFEELSRNPAHAAMLAQVSKQSGFVREESGKPRVIVGPLSLDASRLNPVMESLHLTQYAAQVFGEVAGSDEVQRQNELTGRQRGPFAPGPSVSAGLAAAGAVRGGVDEAIGAAGGDLLSWMWPARVAMDYGDGDEATSPIDTFWSQMVPATANDPERRREMLRKRYKSALGEIKKKYEQAQNATDRDAYAAEAERLKATATRLFGGIQ